ncbi:MAG: RNA methyltransferase [SAR324 cluster bacterium]|nr:RNA methyltransferase [SAR324 cluster bacterium]
MGLEHIRIILVEPAGALNVGAIARVMKNFGLKTLVLVNPQCSPLSKDAQKMAVHAQDVLECSQQFPSLQKALANCSQAVATTARNRNFFKPLDFPKAALSRLLEISEPVALIFGSEESGLSNADLQLAQYWMQIPANPEYPTLNLAQSVALCCYELFQQSTSNAPEKTVEKSATLGEMDAYLNQMASLLLEIGYLHPHTETSRMNKFRQLLYRSTPGSSEIDMLRGVLTQMQWALKNKK